MKNSFKWAGIEVDVGEKYVKFKDVMRNMATLLKT
jgi:hypothetical protein